MDLELPRFATPDDSGVDRVYRSQWVVTQQSPASPAPLRSPSLCLNLDTLSSDGSVGPGDISTVPICISDQSSHSGDPDQVLFDDDLQPDNHVDLVSPDSPTVSARMSPDSSPEAPVVRLADSSAPISPNRVRSDCTPNTLEAGPVFEVSPDITGFLLRTRDDAEPTTPVGLPIHLRSESDYPLSWGNR